MAQWPFAPDKRIRTQSGLGSSATVVSCIVPSVQRSGLTLRWAENPGAGHESWSDTDLVRPRCVIGLTNAGRIWKSRAP